MERHCRMQPPTDSRIMKLPHVRKRVKCTHPSPGVIKSAGPRRQHAPAMHARPGSRLLALPFPLARARARPRRNGRTCRATIQILRSRNPRLRLPSCRPSGLSVPIPAFLLLLFRFRFCFSLIKDEDGTPFRIMALRG
ncbi:hypothetical protein MPTK1_7g12710 [Marchantia polymorpha subsp. ruderalis]|uniref:Uncharacterized protein n=2 Tax=Marchantia polymorpha TaxID=3197 RepID=A0AAF6BYW3_MARPO|nr:hypothetical protein MARPO_0003s0279 [Marchantia polymorpha]BBN17197.1 hypothetical protein Mp_7g12710 [Marchantia polymorpha subsp. ruderalis]|eukprot:PTQ49432.1 hypothetical protein MARPO_0003s0279 [Marchantia polymorpha]